MATVYKTPGVYSQEVPSLPPSVAEVSTAIPAFIGYVSAADAVPARITSLLEYRQLFGDPPATEYSVAPGDAGAAPVVTRKADAEARLTLYYYVAHYFTNGGGPCWIVPVGGPRGAVAKADFLNGLAAVAAEDEPTLLLFPEAANGTLAAADYGEIAQAALAQAASLTDRFVVLDVPKGDVAAFRDALGTAYLSYGAAYHPFLETTLSPAFNEAKVIVGDPTQHFTLDLGDDNGLRTTSTTDGTVPSVRVRSGAGDPGFSIAGATLVVEKGGGKTAAALVAAFAAWITGGGDAGSFKLIARGDGSSTIQATDADGTPMVKDAGSGGDTLDTIRDKQTALYNRVKDALMRERLVLPPSAAVVGLYARTDRDRGVWKAPANVSISGIVQPVSRLTDEVQDGLNIDPTGGKSINAIRAFTGKGTLIWGARTLAGNDNEWRYVSVRRLFITIEESSRKASAFAVFEPNDATTWLKVKGMIESYLYALWERGALAGSKPEAAYYVQVGLGRTMTAQDVLEGRMIVEIGIAAVRPAEFVILRFSHRIQQN